MAGTSLPERLLLFDGVCHLCNGLVRFVAARDRRGHIRFATLQGRTGEQVLAGQNMASADLNTLIYVRRGRMLTRSSAALWLARDLDGAWPLLFAFMAVPRPLRDAAYAAVARRRYRWFGRTATCMVPGPGLAGRFVD